MPSEARQKKIMEKLNRAQKCSILGPQNLGSRGAQAPWGPLDPHLQMACDRDSVVMDRCNIFKKPLKVAEFPKLALIHGILLSLLI